MSPSAVSVSNSAICARPKSSSRTSISSDSASRTFDGFTSRWTMPAAVRVRERLGDLRGDLDRAAVVELAGAHRLAQRPARDVLVGDVDVRRVAREREDPLAARVPQRGRRARLALGPVARLALARDDLQRDVEAAPLVAREPDLAHAAGAQRPQRPVPAEDEVAARAPRRTPLGSYFAARRISCSGRTIAGRFDRSHGPARRRHRVRLLRGRAADDRRPSDVARAPAAARRPAVRRGARSRGRPARADAAPAPARAASRSSSRCSSSSGCCSSRARRRRKHDAYQQLHGQGRDDRAQLRRTTAPRSRTRSTTPGLKATDARANAERASPSRSART